MLFGATFLANPPAARLVELAVAAEAAGFDYVWLNDCDTLFEDPWPVFALIARETTRVKIGPCVTNPLNRDWSVTAGLIATLNDISGGRIVCGMGRGDAAVRMLGQRPASPRQMEDAIRSIRALVGGRSARIGDTDVRLAWTPGWELEMWGAGYGPAVLEVIGRVCDGCILQAADPTILEWTRGLVAAGATAAGRDPDAVKIMVGAPAYVTADLGHAHDQLRWFGASVANHAAELVARYGDAVPAGLSSLLDGRPEYDYAQKGKPGSHASGYITDEVNARLCLVGEPDQHLARLDELAKGGADAYTIYLNHDDVEATIEAYGRHVIPAMR